MTLVPSAAGVAGGAVVDVWSTTPAFGSVVHAPAALSIRVDAVGTPDCVCPPVWNVSPAPLSPPGILSGALTLFASVAKRQYCDAVVKIVGLNAAETLGDAK